VKNPIKPSNSINGLVASEKGKHELLVLELMNLERELVGFDLGLGIGW
jgi:hypothetical protein